MNKRELIKALFKNPTIKALYESGHFHASDINRVILMEAVTKQSQGEFNMIHDSARAISNDIKGLVDLIAEKEYSPTDLGLNYQQEEILKSYEGEDPIPFLLSVFEDPQVINALKGPSKEEIFTLMKSELRSLNTALLKLKQNISDNSAGTDAAKTAQAGEEVDAAAETATNDTDQKLQGSKGRENKKDGEGTPNNVAEFASYFDTAIPKEVADEFITTLFPENPDSDVAKLTKAFVVHYFIENNILNEAEGQLPAWEASFESFKTEMELGEQEIQALLKILDNSDNVFHTAAAKVRDFIGKPDAEPQDEQDIKKKRQQLYNRSQTVLNQLNIKSSSSVEFEKSEPFMIFLGTVLEKEGVIQEQEQQMESYVEKYLPQLENEDTRKEFYITTEEVDDLKSFLKNNKDDVDILITSAVKATVGNAKADLEDVSPPEPAEFQEAWIENLQTFFGKNPNKSSFMRRLLLRDQAKMLYEAIATLEAIKKGTGKTGEEGEEQTALTGMNQDDEKEKIANKPTEPTVQKEVLGLKDPGDAEQVAKKKAEQDAGEEERKKEMQTAQQQSMNTAVQNYQPETNEEGEVKLPSKTKRIIKQDLQAMVDLLRDVKKVLKSYSDNATKTSVDPRFDGSKLKARLDELLTQVQEDIFELHSNLKVPSKPEGEENQLEEALQGIFLEEADPERKEKIALVREVYDEAKRQYISVLSVSMEGKEWDKSKASAGQILEILKREDFISLFPTGMSTSSGKIVTVSQANDVMKGLIQEFIEIVRDIILISKTDYVSPSDLGRAGRQLVFISKEIAEYFKIASKFPPKEIKKAKVDEAAKPENQAITPVPPEKLEAKAGDTASGPATDENGALPPSEWEIDGDDGESDTGAADEKIEKIKEDIEKLPEGFVKYELLIYDLLKVSNITDFLIEKNLGVPFLAYVAKINDFLNGTHNEMGYELDNIIQTDTETTVDDIEKKKDFFKEQYKNFIMLANNLYGIDYSDPENEDKVLKAILLAQQQVQQVNDDGIFSDYNKELLKDPILEMTPQIRNKLLYKMKEYNDKQAKVKTDNPADTGGSISGEADGTSPNLEQEPEVTEEDYETEVNNSTFKSLKKIVDDLYGDKTSKEKLFAFKVGRAFTKAYLEAKADDNSHIRRFIKSMEKKGRFNEAKGHFEDITDFSFEASLWDEMEFEPESEHERALDNMDYIGGGIPKGAGKFLRAEENKDFYLRLLGYTKNMYAQIIKKIDSSMMADQSWFDNLEESLKPIIEKMLKEHYNY